MPAQVGDIESFAHHGLYRVPKEFRYFADLDGHVRSRLPNVAGFICGFRLLQAGISRQPCSIVSRPAEIDWVFPQRTPYLRALRLCVKKNRSISCDALGPWGSVYEPLWLPPDQA